MPKPAISLTHLYGPTQFYITTSHSILQFLLWSTPWGNWLSCRTHIRKVFQYWWVSPAMYWKVYIPLWSWSLQTINEIPDLFGRELNRSYALVPTEGVWSRGKDWRKNCWLTSTSVGSIPKKKFWMWKVFLRVANLVLIHANPETTKVAANLLHAAVLALTSLDRSGSTRSCQAKKRTPPSPRRGSDH